MCLKGLGNVATTPELSFCLFSTQFKRLISILLKL